MERTRAVALVVFTTGALSALFALTSDRTSCAEREEGTPQATVESLFSGKLRIVDLSYALNGNNPYWPGEKYEPFEIRTIATLEADGVLSKAISLPEHFGTHIDAPNHFEAMRPSVDRIPLTQLFGPGVLIDVAPLAEQDPDFQLEVSHLVGWEKKHGPIPEGAIVLLRTGWSRYWNNAARYRNQDVRGTLHFPGYSAAAARFLVNERHIRGLGIDTLSIDRGMSKEFDVHHIVNKAQKFGLENVANLDKLPPRGFYLILAPMKIEGGTGGPTRIFAVLPETA